MISAVILARNEEKNLTELIPTLSFCDEVIVVDNDSTDGTVEIAQKYKAHIIHDASSDFSHLRNNALKIANGDWIFFVDADERISNTLQDEIVTVTKSASQYVGWYISRQDIFWGKRVNYGEVLSARVKGILRLVRKNSGEWKGAVHEVYIPNGLTGKLKNPIMHHSHKGIADFLEAVNTFSTRRADAMYKNEVRLWALPILIVPFSKFLYTYLLLGGFLDGARGFVYSFMMSFHSFLTRSKVYLLQNR